MKINLNIKKWCNKIYVPYYKDTRKFQVYYGGAGSGKSHFIAQKILGYLMVYEGFNWMVVRHTAADNHDSTFALLKQLVYARPEIIDLFKINGSHGKESITFKPNGNTIIFKGLDDVEKRKGVTFSNGILQGIWIEEASETSEANLNQLDIRLRGKSKLPKMMLVSFNPVDENHWLKRRFFDIPMDEADGFVLKTTYKDNEHLTDDDRKALEKYKQIDEYYYQVYCLGNWGNISNAKVFKNVVVDEFEYTLDDLTNVRYGMDYGYVHASTLMTTGYRDGDLYIIGEHYYKEHTNREFIDKVERAGFSKSNHITADSAEPDRIREWKNAGFRVAGAKKGKNSLKDGVDYLQSIPTIHIHKTKCPNASREFLNFKRRELKDGSIVEQFVEIDDDTIAGVRYGNEEFWGKAKKANIVRW